MALLLQFLNVSWGKLIQVGQVKAECRDPARCGIDVHAADTFAQNLPQFPRTVVISSLWVSLLPFFGHPVEQTHQEDARTAGRVKITMPKQGWYRSKRYIEHELGEETRRVEHAFGLGGVFVRFLGLFLALVTALQESFIYRADGLDRDDPKIVNPEWE